MAIPTSNKAATRSQVIDAQLAQAGWRKFRQSLSLEGSDIGRVEGVTVQVLDDGPGAAWLPQAIELTARGLTAPLRCAYGAEDGVSVGKPLFKALR